MKAWLENNIQKGPNGHGLQNNVRLWNWNWTEWELFVRVQYSQKLILWMWEGNWPWNKLQQWKKLMHSCGVRQNIGVFLFVKVPVCSLRQWQLLTMGSAKKPGWLWLWFLCYIVQSNNIGLLSNIITSSLISCLFTDKLDFYFILVNELGH